MTFSLEPAANYVKPTATHQGIPNRQSLLDGFKAGWPAISSSLKSLLETGWALTISMDLPD